MSILGTMLDYLNMPGGYLRGALADPASVLLGGRPWEQKSGRELLTDWGLTAPNDPNSWEAADFAGYGAEVLLDPLNAIPAGSIAKLLQLRKLKYADDIADAASKIEDIAPPYIQSSKTRLPQEAAFLNEMRQNPRIPWVRDDSGNVKRLFHGTPQSFEGPHSRDLFGQGAGGDLWGKGVYLTDSGDLASQYAKLTDYSPHDFFNSDSAPITQLGHIPDLIRGPPYVTERTIRDLQRELSASLFRSPGQGPASSGLTLHDMLDDLLQKTRDRQAADPLGAAFTRDDPDILSLRKFLAQHQDQLSQLRAPASSAYRQGGPAVRMESVVGPGFDVEAAINTFAPELIQGLGDPLALPSAWAAKWAEASDELTGFLNHALLWDDNPIRDILRRDTGITDTQLRGISAGYESLPYGPEELLSRIGYSHLTYPGGAATSGLKKHQAYTVFDPQDVIPYTAPEGSLQYLMKILSRYDPSVQDWQ